MRATQPNSILEGVSSGLGSFRGLLDKLGAAKFKTPQGIPGIGTSIIGTAPEEVHEWASGFSPFSEDPNLGNLLDPRIKPGREQGVIDTAFLASSLNGLGSLRRGAIETPRVPLNSWPRPAEIRGWHGSRSVFAPTEANPLGEFDYNNYSLTGSGAQMMGPGTYLADSRSLAHDYTGRVKHGDTSGSLYEVRIPTNMVDRMVDFYAPLYKQPEYIKNAVRKIIEDKKVSEKTARHLNWWLNNRYDSSIPGGTLHEFLQKKGVNLADYGVPGIKYGDGSKHWFSGEKGYNYVISPGEEKNVKIVSRKAKGGSVTMPDNYRAGGRVRIL
jgi:hypothetical protein